MDLIDTVDVAPDELNAVVTRLFVRLRHHLVQQGASVPAAQVLAYLRDHGPSRVTEIAAALQVAQPTMTTQLQRLTSQGWLGRVDDPADGRAVRVDLTGPGRAVLDSLVASRSALLLSGLGRLDAEDQARIRGAIPALRRLAAALDPDQPPGPPRPGHPAVPERHQRGSQEGTT